MATPRRAHLLWEQAFSLPVEQVWVSVRTLGQLPLPLRRWSHPMTPSFLRAEVPSPRSRLPNRPERHQKHFPEEIAQIQIRQQVRTQAPWVVLAQASEVLNQVQASCPLRGRPFCDYRRQAALKGRQIVANPRSARPTQATLAYVSQRRADLPSASW